MRQSPTKSVNAPSGIERLLRNRNIGTAVKALAAVATTMKYVSCLSPSLPKTGLTIFNKSPRKYAAAAANVPVCSQTAKPKRAFKGLPVNKLRKKCDNPLAANGEPLRKALQDSEQYVIEDIHGNSGCLCDLIV
jgi:hypothetical protein